MYYLSFPGLGIEPFHIDKVAFSVFGRDVAWYGLLITCGMEGPRFIQAGGSLFVWLLWCLLSAGVLYLSEFILRAFRR